MSYNKAKGFSGKSALIQEQKEARRKQVDEARCPTCQVPLLSDTKVNWCRVRGCPNTNKSRPSKEEIKKLKMDSWY